MSSAVDAASDAIEENIGGFEPGNIGDLGSFLAGLPRLHEALASAYQRVADRFADDLPLDPAVAEHIRELASQAAAQQDYAAETLGLFRSLHEQELERIENPRPNEKLWDVVENQ